MAFIEKLITLYCIDTALRLGLHPLSYILLSLHTVPFTVTCFTSLKAVVSMITFVDLASVCECIAKKHTQKKSLILINPDLRLISCVHACVHSVT